MTPSERIKQMFLEKFGHQMDSVTDQTQCVLDYLDEQAKAKPKTVRCFQCNEGWGHANIDCPNHPKMCGHRTGEDHHLQYCTRRVPCPLHRTEEKTCEHVMGEHPDSTHWYCGNPLPCEEHSESAKAHWDRHAGGKWVPKVGEKFWYLQISFTGLAIESFIRTAEDAPDSIYQFALPTREAAETAAKGFRDILVALKK